jgi:hypothetical protein
MVQARPRFCKETGVRGLVGNGLNELDLHPVPEVADRYAERAFFELRAVWPGFPRHEIVDPEIRDAQRPSVFLRLPFD